MRSKSSNIIPLKSFHNLHLNYFKSKTVSTIYALELGNTDVAHDNLAQLKSITTGNK